jgi:hypothetical protein
MNRQKSEKGQIIIILALSLVAIMAITALAIDGSLIYNERRQDQNTADSLALSGAGAAANYLKDISSGVLICGTTVGTNATTEIVNMILETVETDYREENNIPEDVEVMKDELAVYMPKLANDTELAAAVQGYTVTCNWYETLGIQYLDFHVKVSTEMPTNFARVISQNTLNTTVESTARVYPKQPFAYGNGLVSLSQNCGNTVGGISFKGNAGTYITEGGVFSNSCIEALGSMIVSVTGGSIQYWHESECKDCFNNENITPVPIKAYTRLSDDMISAPTCPAKTTGNTSSSKFYSGTINPGWYTKGIEMQHSGGTLTLNPGLYCIEGDFANNSQSTLIADGVTLVFYSGNIIINQNDKGAVQMSACSNVDGCWTSGFEGFKAIQGLLIYINPSYQADVQINGGSTNSFTGTIFGPNANFQINGNTDTASTTGFDFNTQIVGNYIKIDGNANLVMNLNSTSFVQVPPSLSLIK